MKKYIFAFSILAMGFKGWAGGYKPGRYDGMSPSEIENEWLGNKIAFEIAEDKSVYKSARTPENDRERKRHFWEIFGMDFDTGRPAKPGEKYSPRFNEPEEETALDNNEDEVFSLIDYKNYKNNAVGKDEDDDEKTVIYKVSAIKNKEDVSDAFESDKSTWDSDGSRVPEESLYAPTEPITKEQRADVANMEDLDDLDGLELLPLNPQDFKE